MSIDSPLSQLKSIIKENNKVSFLKLLFFFFLNIFFNILQKNFSSIKK
jgi:hypothetical protein